ncbi:MAG TPA: hypothetical protein VKX30_02860 [Flavobacteriaceae bacterium]|nr:hypothetical protein [Flavobacteriaceae bacterium]
MKKFIVLLMLGLFSLSSYADAEPIKSTFNEVIIMNEIILAKPLELPIIQEDIASCYFRICWNVGETRRQCTEWVEVPCETELELESEIRDYPK